MRPLTGLISFGLLAMVANAEADPRAAPGYAMQTAQESGAIFAGLARDGDALLATNLADGRLYRRSAKGNLIAFGPRLPHGADVMGDPTGPYRIARYGSSYIIAQGWTPVDNAENAYDHALIEVDEASVVRVISGDFWNPYAFTVSGNRFYVIDAARNSVERVSIDSGARDTLFTFARLTASGSSLQALSPTEFSKTQGYEFDAVPTGIVAREGRLYVALFGGFPFIEGSGRIVSLPEAGPTLSARIEVADLNAPVDVAFDTNGDMLVLEHGKFNQSSGWLSGSGRLLRIKSATGERQMILEGLTRPVSVLVWDNRSLVVSELGGNLCFLTARSPE
jgi:hypothetical protein